MAKEFLLYDLYGYGGVGHYRTPVRCDRARAHFGQRLFDFFQQIGMHVQYLE